MEWLFFENVYLAQKLDELKKSGNGIEISEEGMSQDLIAALKEIIDTKNALIDSLNAQLKKKSK